MVKPFLSEATLSKIRVFGHEPERWKAALLEEIDADQLPVLYGGTMTDPDGNPACLTKVRLQLKTDECSFTEVCRSTWAAQYRRLIILQKKSFCHLTVC